MEFLRCRSQILIVAIAAAVLLAAVLLAAVLLAAVLLAAGAGWRLCQHDSSIAFLPVKTGAQWILDPAPPEISVRPNAPVKNIFQCRFTLAALPAKATLTICAFKNAAIFLNGHEVSSSPRNEKNWKQPVTMAVTERLQAGTNELVVWVTNNAGPPALWVRLQADDFSLSSDATWQVSLTGQAWTQAQLAAEPVPIPRWSAIFDDISIGNAVERQWRNLALLLAIALGICFLAQRERVARAISQIKFPPIYLLLLILLIARVALFINDVSKLPEWMGFDQPSHWEYIQFVEQHGTLPPLDSGAETHQPPLHYLISAAAVKLGESVAVNTKALICARAVNGGWGLLHCWLALLCLRRLFPNNFAAQAVGLLTAALLPPYLYLSLGITNDPLTGLLITTAFYFLLRAFQSETENLRPYIGVGLALGGAMLTKLSALPALPVFFIAIGFHLVQRKKNSWRNWLGSVGTVAFFCALVCGWHYLRAWSHNGAIALPQSDGNAWWQSPGVRTASFYLSFGRVLVWPLFSGMSSFADGIYATFWGDGMISGAMGFIFRPPWNYELMKVDYLLALPLTLLAVGGIAIVVRRGFREFKAEWFFIIGMIFIYALALVFITLLGPWQSQVKAFYAIAAFMPVCAVIAAGWDWLAKRSPSMRSALWVLMLVWSLITFTSFWINGQGAEFKRSQTLTEFRNQHFTASVNAGMEALRLNPDDFETHCLLANTYISQKRPAAAIQQYTEALQINPEAPEILNIFAQMQVDGDAESIHHAVGLAERACQLTQYRQADLLTTLALAYANAGQTENAIITATSAIELAQQNSNADLLKQNQELIKRCRATKASEKNQKPGFRQN